jgi:hypothetical protein
MIYFNFTDLHIRLQITSLLDATHIIIFIIIVTCMLLLLEFPNLHFILFLRSSF